MAEGPMSLAVNHLADLISESARFQTLTESGDSTAARASVMTPQTSREIKASCKRPFAVVGLPDPMSLTFGDGNISSGELDFHFEINVRPVDEGKGGEQAAAIWFADQIGVILQEMNEYAWNPANGQIAINSLSAEMPKRSSEAESVSQGEYFVAFCRVSYGPR